jgi:hypothetical protein
MGFGVSNLWQLESGLRTRSDLTVNACELIVILLSSRPRLSLRVSTMEKRLISGPVQQIVEGGPLMSIVA